MRNKKVTIDIPAFVNDKERAMAMRKPEFRHHIASVIDLVSSTKPKTRYIVRDSCACCKLAMIRVKGRNLWIKEEHLKVVEEPIPSKT
jgi:hypothetical protein